MPEVKSKVDQVILESDTTGHFDFAAIERTNTAQLSYPERNVATRRLIVIAALLLSALAVGGPDTQKSTTNEADQKNQQKSQNSIQSLLIRLGKQYQIESNFKADGTMLGEIKDLRAEALSKIEDLKNLKEQDIDKIRFAGSAKEFVVGLYVLHNQQNTAEVLRTIDLVLLDSNKIDSNTLRYIKDIRDTIADPFGNPNAETLDKFTRIKRS